LCYGPPRRSRWIVAHVAQPDVHGAQWMQRAWQSSPNSSRECTNVFTSMMASVQMEKKIEASPRNTYTSAVSVQHDRTGHHITLLPQLNSTLTTILCLALLARQLAAPAQPASKRGRKSTSSAETAAAPTAPTPSAPVANGGAGTVRIGGRPPLPAAPASRTSAGAGAAGRGVPSSGGRMTVVATVNGNVGGGGTAAAAARPPRARPLRCPPRASVV